MIDRMRRYRHWGVAAAVVAVCGAVMLIWVLRLLASPTYGGVSMIDEVINRRTDVPAPEIAGAVRISQRFVASDDDLAEIRVFLGSYGRINTAPLILTLSKRDGSLLRSVQADPATIYDNAYHSFVFDPIPDSRGTAYTATLSSPMAKPGNAFTAWIGNCNCYPDGVLSVNGKVRPDQELAMRVDYHHGSVVVWRELINRMSQYKPEAVKGVGLVMLGLASTALAIAALGSVVLSTGVPASGQGRPLRIAISVVVAVVVVVVTGAYEGL